MGHFDLIEEAEDGRLHRRGYVNDPGVGSDDCRCGLEQRSDLQHRSLTKCGKKFTTITGELFRDFSSSGCV